jgi:predicted peptidase
VTVRGATYHYQVYVPREYTPKKLWPVIVDLHGHGSQGDDGLRQTFRGIADAIRVNRSPYPAIVVFPQAQVGTRFSYPGMQEMVAAELDQAIQEFHGDGARVYLIRFSMGGGGVYRIASRWPERFAALVAIAGPVEELSGKMTEDAIEIDRKTNAFTSAADPFHALAKRIRAIPTLIFHGEADQSVPVEHARRLSSELKKAGATVQYTEYPATDHVGAASKAYRSLEMIEWLLAQRRQTR